jgi:DNA topoisomerase-3
MLFNIEAISLSSSIALDLLRHDPDAYDGPAPMLLDLLKSRFGFDRFRPQQEAICRAVAEGRDSLVVMPTGAGKSLCYQLPGLARGGTTLVISPLVALIEDQVHRLNQRGMKAGRIHSGRAREESRETFRQYLRKELEFLFIAPERLAVPGFPEMLKQHPPSLIAVDEAHCISQWGHDFRPDYRLVGERLQGITTPIVALTATATPLVQKDICEQLRLRTPELHIHGFRRENLAIRAVEANPSARIEKIAELLSEEGSRPAIVYAPTRKKAEEIAREIGRRFKAAAYHAGMPAGDREEVQLGFLNDTVEVIVATVAFGMGIDKPNVRTVIHAALPGSIEGYYQEIGRAGRDGLPSRALLLHSFADRKTHEFFLDRDHPETTILAKIRAKVPEQGAMALEELRLRCREVEPEVFDKAIEKLWMHGGLVIDPEENVSMGSEKWARTYEDQRRHRLKQLDLLQNFAEGRECRMLQLVRHFGDTDDSSQPCGLCDRCVPSTADVRLMDELERGVAAQILAALSTRDGLSVGRLFEEAGPFDRRVNRSGFERVLSAIGRAGLVETVQAEFEKDGKTISFRKVHLTSVGRTVSGDRLAEIEIEGPAMTDASSSSGRVRKRKPTPASPVSRPPGIYSSDEAPGLRTSSSDWERPSEMPKLFEELRAWRLEEARRKGVPAFRIVTDRVLFAICESMPTSEEALLQVPGIGPKLVKQYGDEIIRRVSA